ncbi:MAG: periplasmic heavy metal sensor [Paracoccaceae bacterium]
MTDHKDELPGTAPATAPGNGAPPPPPPPPPLPPPAAPVARAGKGLRIALGVSVALNLLVAGLVAGAVLRDGDPRARMVRDLDFGPFTEALSPRDREALRRDFLTRAPEMRDVRRQMRADLGAFLQILRSDPLDAEALAGVLANQRERLSRRVDLGQDLLLERLSEMTREERLAFADRLERRLRRGGGKEGGQGGGGEARPAP